LTDTIHQKRGHHDFSQPEFLDPGLYEAQWVTPGPASRDMIIVRSGLRPRTLVVTRGLAALVAAARDLLKKGAHRRRG